MSLFWILHNRYYHTFQNNDICQTIANSYVDLVLTNRNNLRIVELWSMASQFFKIQSFFRFGTFFDLFFNGGLIFEGIFNLFLSNKNLEPLRNTVHPNKWSRGGHKNSFIIHLKSSRTFRGSLFHKPITSNFFWKHGIL